MDALSDILGLVRLGGVVYFRKSFAAPWGFDMPRGALAQFHHVARGRCVLTMDGLATPRVLEAGDLIVLMQGDAHGLADQAGTPRRPGAEVIAAHRSGAPLFDGDGEETVLVCGHFSLDRHPGHPLLSELPSLIHLGDHDAERRRWLDSVIQAIIAESRDGAPGSALVIDRLAEVLFVHVLRCHLADAPMGAGHLAALADPRLARALSHLHAHAAHAVTLDDAAGAAGMSRSAFAERFRRVVGVSPMRYLGDWRMLKAHGLLDRDRLSVAEAAAAVGYASEAAFARAFKTRFGTGPGSVRRGLAAPVGQPSP